jgi:hypothetical protein
LSVAAPKNTLAYQLKGRPLTMKRDLSHVSITQVTPVIRMFHQAHGEDTQPETDAIMFYLANHAMKELAFRFDPLEPLPDWAMEMCNEYHRVAAVAAARAFYYMLMITAREARHNKNKEDWSWKNKVKAKFGSGPMMALTHYPDHASVDKVTDVFDQHAAGAPLGDICRSIVYTHYEGSFHGSYGGPAWGNVSDCMTAFATGQASAEVMLDTVWTLVHNGGPIFNKGMLYNCYDGQSLQEVLDIQRAGQIPRLVLAPYGKFVAAEEWVNDGAKKFAEFFIQHMGEVGEFRREPVDFQQVQELGAVGNYDHLIKKLKELQDAAKAKPAPQAAPAYQSPSKPWEAPAQPVITEQTHFIIAKAQGLHFKKLTRKEVHAK